MKKKYLIFPVVALVLSVLAGIIMLVFTTSFVYEFHACRSYEDVENNPKYDYFGVVNKSGKFTQLAYKIEPNFSNLYVLRKLYSPYMVVFYINYCDESYKEEINKLPSDFYEKSIEYSKLYYDYLLENYDLKQKYSDLSNNVMIVVGGEKQELLSCRCDYINALYLNGQKDEARRLVEETLENFDSYDDPAISVTYGLIDFVYLVHNMETDKEYQKWMLETERKLTKEYNKRAIAERRFDNFYREWNPDETPGTYKPFK